MTMLPKAVIEDLLPLYAAGEASAETVALVEQELVRYPELRAQVEAMRRVPVAVVTDDAVPDGEVAAVQETGRLLSRRSWALGIGLFTSFLPSGFSFQSPKLTFVMARDQPVLSFCSVLIAYCAWMVYFHARRRLSMTGLQAGGSVRKRLSFALLGFLLGGNVASIGAHGPMPYAVAGVLGVLSAGLFFWQSRTE